MGHLYEHNKLTAEKDDWNIVVAECASLSAKWKQLSVRMGLPSDLIDTIKCNHGDDAEDCWGKALNEWICQNYNTAKFHMPSWRTLLRAIAKVDRLLFHQLRCKHSGKWVLI